MSSIADVIRKESKKKVVQNRTNRVQRSIKKSSYGKSKPSKSDVKYINGDLAGASNGRWYGIKKFGGGDFSYQKKVLEAGNQKLSRYEAQKRGENPYELKYMRTNQPTQIKTKDGKSFTTYNRRVQEYDKRPTIAQIYTPKTKLERTMGKVGRGFNKALTTLNKGQSAFLGGLKTVGDESQEFIFENDKFRKTGGFKDTTRKLKRNVSQGWKTGENSFGTIINEKMDKTEKEENMKFTKGARRTGSVAGFAMDIFNPYDLTPNVPIGTLVKGTGKSFTKVPKNIHADDVAKTLDNMLGNRKISEQAREAIIHKSTKKANKYAGNVKPRSGVYLGNKELLNANTVAQIGDATGISRAYNEVRHILQKNKRNTNLEDIVGDVANKRFKNQINLKDPLTKTSLKMNKEKYNTVFGITPNAQQMREIARLDNGFRYAIGKKEVNSRPTIKSRTFDATKSKNIQSIFDDVRTKINPRGSIKTPLDELENDLGMSVKEFATTMDKKAQDYALSKLPQHKADMLLDELDNFNPKINTMFDDFASDKMDADVMKDVLAVKKTPHVPGVDKDLEKQAEDAILNLFNKKYNSGHTANKVMPHKLRQDTYVNKMKDLFDVKTPINDKLLKEVGRMNEFVNTLGKKSMKESDKDNIAKTLNKHLFDGNPVIRNNMGDGDFKQFVRLLNDGVEDTINGVPDVLHRGNKDFKMWVNSATDTNADLKRRYLASKYKGEKKQLEANVKEFKALAKKDSSYHGKWKEAENILEARNNEHKLIRDIGEDKWLEYYNGKPGKNILDGYNQAVDEVADMAGKTKYQDTPYSVKYQDEMNKAMAKNKSVFENVGDVNKDVADASRKELRKTMGDIRKQLNFNYLDFNKQNLLNNIDPKLHNKVKEVRQAKDNLVKISNAKVDNFISRQLDGADKIDGGALHMLFKENTGYLDKLGMPLDTYSANVRNYEKKLYNTKIMSEIYKRQGDVPKEVIDSLAPRIKEELGLPDDVQAIRMDLQMLANRFKKGDNADNILKEINDEFTGNKILDTGIADARNSDNVVSMYNDIRKTLPQRGEIVDSVDNVVDDFGKDVDFSQVKNNSDDLLKRLDEFLGVDPNARHAEEAMTREAIDGRISQGKQPMPKDKKNPLLSLYDGLTKDFKSMVTVNKPGWHASNYIQNKVLNAQDIGIDALKNRGTAKDIFKGKEGFLTNPKTGEMIPYQKIKDVLEAEGVLDSNMAHEVMNSGGNNPLSKLFHDVIRPSGKNSIGSGFGLMQKNPDESLSKIQNMISHMNKGDDLYDAIDKAQKTLFDYDDLSKVEKDVMKRVVPFYSYMRKNTENQLGYLLDDQRSYNKVANALRSIESGVDKEREIQDDEKMYLDGRVQIPGMSKEHDGKRYDYMLNPKLPLLDTSGGETIVGDMSKSLNPLLQPLLDITKNKDFFEQPIKDKEAYYKDEVKDSFTPPLAKLMQKIESDSEKGKDFKITPQILNYLLGISGNYY